MLVFDKNSVFYGYFTNVPQVKIAIIVICCILYNLTIHGILTSSYVLLSAQMAIAAIAHVCVFSAKSYNFLPVSEYGKISTRTEKTLINLEKEGKGKGPTMIEKTETEIKAPGTSITESVQDIVVEGGQQV